jgi:hypothetical protein
MMGDLNAHIGRLDEGHGEIDDDLASLIDGEGQAHDSAHFIREIRGS